jgi:inosose dehydratase
MSDLFRLRLGTAPDSWGVWFPSDPHQVGWRQYLDEVAKAGYLYTELGPPGFLPQDPAQLADELAARGLTVSGGTVFAGLHNGKQALDQAIEDFGREARLLSAVGARYLVHLPEQYTDMHSGQATEGAELDPEQWRNLVSGTDELARVIAEEYGVELVFHPHVDTHVDTQPRIERVLTDTYVHLKQVDPQVWDRVVAEQLPLSEAVKLGVMVEPPYGEPAMPPLLAALAALDRDVYCVVEQDLYPVEPDVPLPIAARTAGYFVSCGLGPTRRWPYRR